MCAIHQFQNICKSSYTHFQMFMILFLVSTGIKLHASIINEHIIFLILNTTLQLSNKVLDISSFTTIIHILWFYVLLQKHISYNYGNVLTCSKAHSLHSDDQRYSSGHFPPKTWQRPCNERQLFNYHHTKSVV